MRSKSDPRAAMGLDTKFPCHRSPSDPELVALHNTQPSTAKLIEIESAGPQKENWNPFSPYYTGNDTDFTVDPSECDDDLDFASLRDNLPKDRMRDNEVSQARQGVSGTSESAPGPTKHESDALSPGEFPPDLATNPFLQTVAGISVDVSFSDSSGSRNSSPDQLYNTLTPPLSPGTSDPFGAVPFNAQKSTNAPTSPDVFGAAPFTNKKDIQLEENLIQIDKTRSSIDEELSAFASYQGIESQRPDCQGRESPKNPFDFDTFGGASFPSATERVVVGDRSREQRIPGKTSLDKPAVDSVDGSHDPFGSAPFNSNHTRDANIEPRPFHGPRRNKPGDRPRRRLPQVPTQQTDSAQTSSVGGVRTERRKAQQTIVLSRPDHTDR